MEAIPQRADYGRKDIVSSSAQQAGRADGYDQNYGSHHSVFGEILAFIAEPKIP
jgi:hypothetical protein